MTGAPFRVVVVGAGLAGIAAASTLKSIAPDLCKVTVLEGSHSIGGRVKAGTLPLSGAAVELGATWLHGTQGHPLVELGVRAGLLPAPQHLPAPAPWKTRLVRPHYAPTQIEGDVSMFSGEGVAALGAAPVPPSCPTASLAAPPAPSLLPTPPQPLAVREAALAALAAYEQGSAACMQLSSSLVAAGSQGGLPSKGQVLRLAYDQAVRRLWGKQATPGGLGAAGSQGGGGGGGGGKEGGDARAVFDATWRLREALQCSFDGFFSSDDCSCVFPREYQQLAGDNVAVPGGYQALATGLAAGLDIHMGQEVTLIEWDTQGGHPPPPPLPPTPPQPPQPPPALAAVETDSVTAAAGAGLDAPYAAAAAATATGSVSAAAAAAAAAAAGGVGSGSVGSGPAPLRVHCQGGLMLAADAVIVTVSAAVLQARHTALFSPGLPPSKLKALSQIRTGVADKIFIEWPRAPADPRRPDPTGGAGGHSEDLAAAAGGEAGGGGADGTAYCLLWPTFPGTALGMTMDASTAAGAPPPPDPVGTRPGPTPTDPAPPLLENPPPLPPPADTCTSGGTPPPEALPEWVRGLHSIRFGPPGPEWIQAGSSPGGSGGGGPGSSVGAVMWVTGAAALQAEAQTDQEVVAGVQQLLSTFPGVPLPPGLDPSQPPALLRSRWGCDPLFLGSYSYIRAGQGAVDGSTGPDELAQPLMAGGALRLLFAGEATNRQFMGTTHGAWLSGQREAERIAGHVAQQLQQKKKTCPEGA